MLRETVSLKKASIAGVFGLSILLVGQVVLLSHWRRERILAKWPSVGDDLSEALLEDANEVSWNPTQGKPLVLLAFSSGGGDRGRGPRKSITGALPDGPRVVGGPLPSMNCMRVLALMVTIVALGCGSADSGARTDLLRVDRESKQAFYEW